MMQHVTPSTLHFSAWQSAQRHKKIAAVIATHYACAVAGASAAWHLSWVRVVNLATGNRAFFSANAWLDASLPGSNTWVQLAAAPDTSAAATGGLSGQQQQQPGQLGSRSSVFGSGLQYGASEDAAAGGTAVKLTKAWLHSSKLGQPGYNVTFTTSNVLGAGTAARVSGTRGSVQ
jgi:hypothetical protein